MENVFRALSDSGRRKILDIVKNSPGITLQEICQFFDISRYAVMKHLNILEQANLIVYRREGRYKKFYLNTIPLQMIYDRWLLRFTKMWSTRLIHMKYNLEKETIMNSFQDKQVYVLYIRTSPEKLWKALTSPGVTENYFFHTRVQSDFKPGDIIEYEMNDEDGNRVVPVKGKIIESDPPRKLVHSFRHNFGDAGDETYSEASRVTYEIEAYGELVKLTLIHDEFGEDRKTYESTSGGWPMILNGLKTLLETGKPLEYPAA